MIGNVIQKQFLVVKDYPGAAALSFVLMALILVGRAALHPGAGHGGPGMTTAGSQRRGGARRHEEADTAPKTR